VSPDVSLSPGVTLTPTGKLQPGDRLPVAYLLADGTRIDPRFVRPQNLAQDGHTPSEHQVYQALWRAGNGDDRDGAEYRDVAIGQTAIARQTSISKRNLIRILESLHEKLSIETLHLQVSADHTTKTYRVWSMREILARRRSRGFCWTYRNRTVVALVRASSISLSPGDKLTPDDRLTPGVTLAPDDSLSRRPR
jgi:hypothetical protein